MAMINFLFTFGYCTARQPPAPATHWTHCHCPTPKNQLTITDTRSMPWPSRHFHRNEPLSFCLNYPGT